MSGAAGRRAALCAAALALVIGACGGDDETADTSTTATTTTTDRATSSTTAPTSTEHTAGGGVGDEPTFHEDGPSGSGCTPGAGELLDGWWYGTLSGPPSSSLELDLACFYVGPAAEAEAASRGDEVNNDYYVVNDNPAVRMLPLGTDATASCVDLDPVLEMVDCPPSEVAGDWTVWVRVAGGEIDRIWEQYLP